MQHVDSESMLTEWAENHLQRCPGCAVVSCQETEIKAGEALTPGNGDPLFSSALL